MVKEDGTGRDGAYRSSLSCCIVLYQIRSDQIRVDQNLPDRKWKKKKTKKKKEKRKWPALLPRR